MPEDVGSAVGAFDSSSGAQCMSSALSSVPSSAVQRSELFVLFEVLG